MIIGGSLARADDLQRFQTEAAAAAQLQHPNIVALYEVGTHDQQPYFSMEYVNGSSLAQRVALGTLPGRLAASYLEKTARAVHYAHQRGIIHRDLKPANVLLDDQDQPKITDFGLAKLLQTESGQTRTGAVVGTPSYMAPEQAAASKQLGPACDVYSLGAILYELLTGRPPFRGETALATLNLVAEAEPAPPRLLNPRVDADLETICLKCLEKEPARRYASAAALADDLRRYLDGEPIAARRLGRLGRALKWCRRKPAAAALLAVTALALLALVGGAAAFGVHAGLVADEERRLRDAAVQQQTRAEDAGRRVQLQIDALDHLLYLGEMRQADHAVEAADLGRAARLLDKWRPRPGIPDLREWEWYYLKNLCGPRSVLWVPPPRTAPDELAAPPWVTAVAYHPLGKQLASGEGQPGKANAIKLWDLATGKVLHTLGGHANQVTALAYSPDGKWLASASADGTVKLWDAAAGRHLATLRGHKKYVSGVAFRPDGKVLASGGGDGRVHLWPLDGGPKDGLQPLRTLDGPREINGVAFSGRGGLLAAGGTGERAQVHVWDAGTWEPRHRLDHQGEVRGVAFNADGTLLAAGGGRGSKRGELKLWDMKTGTLYVGYGQLSDTILGVAFGGAEQWAAAGSDGVVRVWESVARSEPVRLRGDTQRVFALAFSPDGARLAGGGRDGRVHLWNSDGGHEARLWAAPAAWVAFGASGRTLAAAGQAGADNALFLLPLDRAAPGRAVVRGTTPLRGLALAADGRALVSAGADHVVRLYPLEETGPAGPAVKFEGHTRDVWAVALHPQGTLIASASDDETIRIWNVAKGRAERILVGHTNGVRAVAFSADGTRLVSGSVDRTVRVWDVATGKELQRLEGHGGSVKAVAFHPDGQRVASAGVDRTVRVWDLATGTAEKLEGSAGVVAALAFHPHGRRLASAGEDRVVRLWDLVSGQEILELTGATGSLSCVAFSADGRYLACCGPQTAVRVWEAPGVRRP
jgi:WD40 repeat protein